MAIQSRILSAVIITWVLTVLLTNVIAQPSYGLPGMGIGIGAVTAEEKQVIIDALNSAGLPEAPASRIDSIVAKLESPSVVLTIQEIPALGTALSRASSPYVDNTLSQEQQDVINAKARIAGQLLKRIAMGSYQPVIGGK